MDFVLRTKDLHKRFRGFTALNGITMNVPKGSIYGFVGRNGAGKTTLIRLITGLQLPTSGEFEIYGVKNSDKMINKSRKRMGAVVETPAVYLDLTARENLKQQCRMLGLPDFKGIDELLELVGLADTGRKKVKNFSLGMKQRLGIAVALCGEPDFIVLDEPINGLDPEGIVEIREMLLKLNREEHITIVISSHILSALSLLCSDYLFIRHGELIESLSAEQLKRKCHEYYHIRTDNDSLVPAVLQNKLGITDIEVEKDGSVRVFESLDDMRRISRTLYENGITPVELHLKDADLESYYMDLVGEENVQSDKGTAVQDAS